MTFRPVTHCVFDLDGTLVDSESIYYKAIDGVCKRYGKSHSSELSRKINGTTSKDYSQIIVADCQLPISPDEFLQQMFEIADVMFANIKLLPGVSKLIHHLHNHNIPIAIGTSSAMVSVEIKLSKHQELAKLFHHIVTGGDDPEVIHGKPAPDTFLVAAKRFEPAPAPEQILVFEDSLNGARAGLAAGMQVVLIPDPEVISAEQRKIATLSLDSLEDFKPELFGLPPY